MSEETSKKQDIKISLETWDPENGKGIDDLLAAGHSPQVLDGEAALAFAKQVKKEAQEADPSPAMKRIQEQIERVKEEQSAVLAFDEDFIKSLAGQSSVVIGEVKAALKEVLGSKLNLNDFSKAIKEAQNRTQRDNLVVITGGGKQEKGLKIPPLLEHEYGYYKNVDRGGEIWPEILSNFKLHTKERIVMQDGSEFVNADLSIEGEKPYPILLPPKAFLSSRDLLVGLKTSRAVWMGKDMDVQLLRNHLLKQNAPTLNGVESVGRYEDYIVLPNIVLDKNGPVEKPSLTLINPGNHNYLDALPKKYPSREEHFQAAKSIYENLTRINEPSVIGSVIGWSFALPWCDLLRTTPGWGGFPHLVIWGAAGSGKTETCKTVLRLSGIPWSFEPFALPKTRFTRLNVYSLTSLTPVFMDEYRPGAWPRHESSKVHEEWRGCYNRLQDERGQADLSTKTYSLCAPLIIAGEDRPRDTTALEERIIAINPKKEVVAGETKEFGTECKKAFSQLHQVSLEDFALPFWSWSLRVADWRHRVQEARKSIINWKNRTGYAMPNRVVNNLAIMLFGWSIFEDYGSYLGLKPASFINGGSVFNAFIAAYLEVMPDGKQTSELDELFIFIGQMVVNGVLEPDVHFATFKENQIVVRIPEILPKAYEYARRSDRKRELLGLDAYRSLIKNAAEKEGSYVLSTSERADFHSPAGGRAQFRGVLIDPQILEEQTGVETNIWFKGTTRDYIAFNSYPWQR
ncbi:MAG: hypothetical protein GX075_12265 [Firmicutes bacterium]|nr:hypothetical protein [Bacillota bacterium]